MRSIRGRLLAILLPGLALVLAGGGVAVYWIARAGIVRELDEGLRVRAQAIASLVVFEPPELVFASGEGSSAILGETYYELWTADGELLRPRDPQDAKLPRRTPAENEMTFDDGQFADLDSARIIWYSFRPRMEAEDDDEREELAQQGWTQAPEIVVVAAAIDRSPTDRALASLVTSLLIAGGAAGVTAALLLLVAVRWGLAPVGRLTRQLTAIDAEAGLQTVDDSGAPRELAPVYRELKAMLGRIDQTLERERSFADAAAHELRTPLAELRATAEVAIRWPEQGRALAALRELHAIGREMERLVESLLLISRANARAGDESPDDVALLPIVQECLDRSNDQIDRKSLQLNVDIEAGDMIRVPRGALEIIVRNLIDNAVDYTPQRGIIAIHDGHNGHGGPVLVVENGPVTLAPDEIPRLFEPFYRMEKARSDRTHLGLGLTVVQRLAEAVGLEVDAELQGDRLQIRLTASNGAH